MSFANAFTARVFIPHAGFKRYPAKSRIERELHSQKPAFRGVPLKTGVMGARQLPRSV